MYEVLEGRAPLGLAHNPVTNGYCAALRDLEQTATASDEASDTLSSPDMT